MGRALLKLAAVAFLVACAPQEPTPIALAAADSAEAATVAHAELTCAACHRGELADGHRASVPGTACAESGCHEDGGPVRVSTKTATFAHRDHAANGEITLSCAGCHTHHSGAEPVTVSVDACALCHLTDIDGGRRDNCRLCHATPDHVAQTSQAVPIPHSSPTWAETGCIRCHYDVAEPAVRVSIDRCTGCHARDTVTIARGVGTDLHPGHQTVNCTSCHEGEAHRVRAMSSAVNLVCVDCHSTAHDVALDSNPTPSRICADCHTTVHQPQQRLMLGLVVGETLAPSAKFLAGLTCRSCHIRNAQADGTPLRGSSASCTDCHPGQYATVLRWWREGTRNRAALVSDYVGRAQRELMSAADSARSLLAGAAEQVELVRVAGGQHNIELSDRLLRASLARVADAYRAAGRAAPGAPALGSPALQGTCTYCHYGSTETWNFRRMSGEFHRSVLDLER